MSNEVKDRDAIVARAIALATVQERDAHITAACGHDPELMRQVRERVAAYLQSRIESGGPPTAAANYAVPSASHRPQAEMFQTTPSQPQATASSSRVLAAAAVFLAVAAVSIIWAIVAVRSENQAQTQARKTVTERDEARTELAEIKKQRDLLETKQRETAGERDDEMKAEREAKRSAEDARAVLAFLQDTVFSTHRPGWKDGDFADRPNPNLKLREAVNAAAAKIGTAFAGQALAEATIREMFGSVYRALGDQESKDLAIKQYERALVLREAYLPPDDRGTVACRNLLSVALREDGRSAEADRIQIRSDESPARAGVLALQGNVALEQQNYADAELKLRQCLKIRQQIRPDHWATFEAQSMLGKALLEQKKYDEAESLLLQGYEGMDKHKKDIPSGDQYRLGKAAERLVRLYEAWGKPDKADDWRKKLEAIRNDKMA